MVKGKVNTKDIFFFIFKETGLSKAGISLKYSPSGLLRKSLAILGLKQK